jgi:hypothetical protein
MHQSNIPVGTINFEIHLCLDIDWMHFGGGILTRPTLVALSLFSLSFHHGYLIMYLGKVQSLSTSATNSRM